MKLVMAELTVYPPYQDDSFDKASNTHRFYGEDAQGKALAKANEFKSTNKHLYLKLDYKIQ